MTARAESGLPVGQEFARLASEYCALIEAHGKMSCQEFLGKTLLTLSRLYAAGINLPIGDCTAKYKEQSLSHKQWEALFGSLARQLGDFQSYWEFFNPRFKEEPVAGNLADDLADIYRDVKSGLEPFDRGSTAVKESVVWHWRFLLSSHWGHHATGALYALHHLFSDGHLFRI